MTPAPRSPSEIPAEAPGPGPAPEGAVPARAGVPGVPGIPDINVSVINYRTAALTIACLRSVLADFAATGIRGRVTVVDNASGDGSAEAVADWIAGPSGPSALPVTLVRSARNTGFSGGHNQGMAATPAPVHLLLNSDAELRPGACAAILEAMRADPRAGVLGARLEWAEGGVQNSAFRVPSPGSELIRATALSAVRRLLDRYDVPLPMGEGAPPDPGKVEWVSFACVALRASMVAGIGPMDEGYFLYHEDTEYCLRAARAGWRVGYVEDARAVHHRGGSAPDKALQRARARLPAYSYASRARLLAQAHGRAGLWAANLAWQAGRAAAPVKALAGRPNPACRAEWRDLWIGARDPWGPDRAPEGAGGRPEMRGGPSGPPAWPRPFPAPPLRPAPPAREAAE